ncbi:MAG: sodium:solute symporter [Gallionella sp.]|nr:sodium:solute symporter [Gallionella sp.]OIO11389.1 MAG: sodium:solute symporter [Gallionellaceae bacterium CG1_02_60_325]PIR09068.1 MAG: sodium:solute symporter [Gallionellaceae bacterium CG11_big_fil_rev_8_21_14_0_20_60_62]PIV48311.1 MAG: sodium:solute symporter [Gallionellaceae bacterium CG02_land_8_20_14_3_00_60_115]
MLIWFVVLYLLFSVGVGVYAARRVHTSRDFVVAGRNLPLPVVTATVFATWFGAETVLGISATFVQEGLGGVVADPFGASLCLILAGLFFAPLLYRMNLLTIGDYYRARYNRTVELIMSICIMLSYLGWVAAQVVALGLVFNVVSNGVVTPQVGMVIGISAVLAYTLVGGMWSVALLDFVQMTVIMTALLLIAVLIGGQAGGAGNVVMQAQTAGKLQLFPRGGGMEAWIPFVGAAVTMMLGSIPQQDVFQRITSARSEKIAVRGAVLGGVLYFAFAFIPMFLTFAATLIDPQFFGELIERDSQRVLPSLILNHTPLIVQIFFFGALLSAIMSTASATLLAPSVMFTENILKHFAFGDMSDKQMLRTMRIILLTFGVLVLWFALNSESSIFHMVENAYKVTLVGAFVPLAFGLYWRRANNQGAILSILLGLGSWLLMELLTPQTYWPPQLVGLLMSVAGMLLGSSLPEFNKSARHANV